MRLIIYVAVLGFFVSLLFLSFQVHHIPSGDSGDLVTGAYIGGIAHPPGYPLYMLFGHIFGKIPFSYPAWRIGLLSSIPHVLTICLIFLSIYLMTRTILSALFGSMMVIGNYIFFLYSITPEVFALFDLFIVMIIFLCLLYSKFKDNRLLLLLAGICGLAISHHHLILFVFPVIFYFCYSIVCRYKNRKKIAIFFSSSSIFLLGLLPYFYIPVAANRNVIINWHKATTFSRFFDLISRKIYGSFQSNGNFGESPYQRFLSIKAFFIFLLQDLGYFGLVLFILGLIWLWKHYKNYFWLLFCCLLMLGPVFLFYASFPLINNFTIGTYERFLLPSIIIIAIFIGCGFEFISSLLKKYTASFLGIFKSKLLINMIEIVLFIIPLTVLLITLWRFWGINQDQTAENLGKDILDSVDRDGILFLRSDTQLFTTQYVRYALSYRPDVKLLHESLTFTDYYPLVIEKYFPELIVPKNSGLKFQTDFIYANYPKFPIYSNIKIPVDQKYKWIQTGLLYKLVDNDFIFNEYQLYNSKLWNSYHNPLAGILSHYKHLMLSDVTNVYARLRLDYGKNLFLKDDYQEALQQFDAAIALSEDFFLDEMYAFKGFSLYYLNNCQDAIVALDKSLSVTQTQNPVLVILNWKYKEKIYDSCLYDPAKKLEASNQLNKLRKKQSTPLQNFD